MKLPFVSRARYDLLQMVYAQTRADLQDTRLTLKTDQAHYLELLDKYHALRASGASPSGPGLTPQLPPSKPSDIAIEQVVERFGNNPRLRRKLAQFQADARRNNADEGEIADNILNWTDPSRDDD